MFLKILKVIIIYVLLSYLLGFGLGPILHRDIFQRNIVVSTSLTLIIFILLTILTFWIAQKSLILKKGEAKKLVLILTVLNLVLGVYGIIGERFVINTFNYLDSSNRALQPTPMLLAILSALIEVAIIYYLGGRILAKSEKIL